ncbi:ABC transporter permease [Pseudalkalibacillus berkeleyi]|uniref:ABC transporter permease n=1 Tax=Pseudalkalibacillus berkeleyi TaxID=1069813 RepID=A0ABS9H1C6_9BACL|nr:ABC transporter permease [Pseudalkalibacillus berkeleyi]MCF6138799.1 ABC transporter permease [Pseudalkalibacillus berkeleyi]
MRTWHFIRNRWKITLNHRWKFIFMLLLPLLFFWTTEQLLSKGSEQLKIPLIIVDEESSQMTEKIINRIKENETLHITEQSKYEALQMLKRNEAEAAVVFTKGLTEQLGKGEIKDVIQLYTAPNAISTNLIEEYVASEVIRIASNGRAATYLNEEFNGSKLYEYAWEYADNQWEPEPLMTVNYETTGQSKTSVVEKDHSPILFGLLSVYILLLSFYLQTWVIHDRKSGIASRTGMFGVSVLNRKLSNLFGVFTLITITMLPSVFYLLKDSDHLLTDGALLLGYMAVCTTISFLIASLFNSYKLYHLMGITITVVSGILGGSFIKLEAFSERFLFASKFTPQYWLLSGISHADNNLNLFIFGITGMSLIILGFGIGVIRHDRT